MTDANVSRLTGTCGLACVVLWLSQFPLCSPASVYDGTAFGREGVTHRL